MNNARDDHATTDSFAPGRLYGYRSVVRDSCVFVISARPREPGRVDLLVLSWPWPGGWSARSCTAWPEHWEPITRHDHDALAQERASRCEQETARPLTQASVSVHSDESREIKTIQLSEVRWQG